ncbi:MAG: MarR family transcriptional regulator [Acidimicrobiia bacterium]|nr:MAG: MarR family transcriptional regulator [Acidimicrobiia bacterium]
MYKPHSNPLKRDQETAWRAFLKAHALLTRQLDRDLRDCCEMTLVIYDALVQLSEAPQQQLRISELADALVYSRSGLTRIVDKMENAGHITRLRDESDRRSWIVTLTPAGLSSLEIAWRTHVQGVERHFASHLTDTQARSVTKSFRAVISAMAPDQTGLVVEPTPDSL